MCSIWKKELYLIADFSQLECFSMADAIIVFLGICDIEYFAPVYLGDTVTDYCIITEVKMREAYDIVTSQHYLINQNEEKIIKVTKNAMYMKGVAQLQLPNQQIDEALVSKRLIL